MVLRTRLLFSDYTHIHAARACAEWCIGKSWLVNEYIATQTRTGRVKRSDGSAVHSARAECG